MLVCDFSACVYIQQTLVYSLTQRPFAVCTEFESREISGQAQSLACNSHLSTFNHTPLSRASAPARCHQCFTLSQNSALMAGTVNFPTPPGNTQHSRHDTGTIQSTFPYLQETETHNTAGHDTGTIQHCTWGGLGLSPGRTAGDTDGDTDDLDSCCCWFLQVKKIEPTCQSLHLSPQVARFVQLWRENAVHTAER